MTTPAARILSNVSVMAPTAFIVKVEEYKLDIVTRDVCEVRGWMIGKIRLSSKTWEVYIMPMKIEQESD
jgi:hypothetical protein